MQASRASPIADSTASQRDEPRSLALGLWVSLAIALLGLLRTESSAALLDTAITGGTGAVLVATPLLTTTPLAPLVVAGEPLHRFRLALRETAGAAPAGS